MAGLGTGAAPFRAFLQHRALLSTQGVDVGPVYYYFGSRHQSQEYLYGEEIEAFINDGVVTRAGLAFSRDGPKKVYIQHKMLEDSEALARMLGEEEKGVFYLCGPTWPVPDVYEALVRALVRYKGYNNEKEAGEYLEGLKEEERYVLEVSRDSIPREEDGADKDWIGVLEWSFVRTRSFSSYRRCHLVSSCLLVGRLWVLL